MVKPKPISRNVGRFCYARLPDRELLPRQMQEYLAKYEHIKWQHKY